MAPPHTDQGPPSERPDHRTRRAHDLAVPLPPWDVALASGAMMIAAAMSFLPDGSLLRAWVTLPILLVAPGYLLVQAIVPEARGWHLALAVGLSAPLVGLLALATTLVPAGFQVMPIVLAVTVGTLALGVVASFRRRVPA